MMRLQAVAMEKAGFEKGTTKYFIGDFDPANPNAPVLQLEGSSQSVDLVARAAPRFVIGGVLLGMGSLALALGMIGMLLPFGLVATAAVVALVVGVILVFNARN